MLRLAKWSVVLKVKLDFRETNGNALVPGSELCYNVPMEPLLKNQIIEAEVEGWSHGGAGVVRAGGRAVFVPGAIPGERWRVRIVKAGAAAVYGKGEALLAASPDRCAPDCPAYPQCGGCALRHVSYDAELRMKLDRVNEAYKRIGGLDLRAETILGAAETEGYRNKAIYAVTPDLRPGFYRPRSHQVIPVERCRLQAEESDRAARAVCDFARAEGFPAYDEATGRGLLRHVFTRRARDGALQVTVVAAGGFGAKTQALAEAVRAACPETVGVILNVNKTRGNTVLAGDFYTLWGADTLSDTLCGSRFELSPQSFYQVNPAQAERLYDRAVAYAAPEGRGLALDLYCGAGTITLALARGGGAGRRRGACAGSGGKRPGERFAQRGRERGIPLRRRGGGRRGAAAPGRTARRGGGGPAQEGPQPRRPRSGLRPGPGAGGLRLLQPRHPGEGPEALPGAGLRRPRGRGGGHVPADKSRRDGMPFVQTQCQAAHRG